MNRLARARSAHFTKLLLAVAASAFAVGACATDAAETEASAGAQKQAQAAGPRVIVKFKNPAARAAVQAAGGSIALDLPSHDAFAAYIPAAAIPGLTNNPSIEYIEEDAIRTSTAETVPWGIDHVQARDVWDADGNLSVDPGAVTGAGVKVCIIDSGLDAAHPDFTGVAKSGQNDSRSGSWSFDSCGHGTHVAGTIAGANDGAGVVGVSPGAVSLHIVKVFGGDSEDSGCDWMYSSSLVAALEECKASGAKVVNMSLGGSFKSRFEDAAFAQAYQEGVLSIAAAGNDGNTRNSYPASYASVMSVAAIDASDVVASFSQQNSQVEIAAPGVDVLSSVPRGTGRDGTTTVDGATYTARGLGGLGEASGALVDCGLAGSTCAGATGKVCLIERGTYTFETKVQNCQAGGGVGAIVFNNAPGIFGSSAGAAQGIPSVSISGDDGAILKGKIGTSASLAVTASDHSFYNGTSMATPHVAGVAALVFAAKPGATPDQVRAALTGSAKDLGAAGRDNAYGYGLVQAKAAIDAINGATEPPPPPPPDEEPPPPPSTCGGKGAACTTGADCCSGNCHPKRKTCNN